MRVDGQTLEPEVQLALSLLERRGAPPLETLPLIEAREAYRRRVAVSNGPPSPVGAVGDLLVEGAAGPLAARHYAPEKGGGPHPLIVYFHGGGFVLGDLDTHDAPCRLLCRHSGAHVLFYTDKLSHHMRTNHRVTIDGDRAEVFSKGYALNILHRTPGSDLWEVWGNYTHTLERTAGGWKCSGMTFVVTYARGNEMARDYLPDQ